MHDYGLSTTQGYIKSSSIIAQLDPSVPLQLAHIVAVRELQAQGCRYSNHDFDVLASAHRAIGRTSFADYEAAWVAAQARKAVEFGIFPLVVVHPVAGLCTFHDYADASAFADDVGAMLDLNHVGTLKSRSHIVHV